jgi:hypothetical protein
VSLIERGKNKTIDIFWYNNPWDGNTWTRFKCQKPGEDATLAFPRCLYCPTFQTTMERVGLMIGGGILEVFREMTPEEIKSYKPPTP